MDQLFDSLSEDWVSQPRSPYSEEAKRSPSVASSPSQLDNVSQSRIPRITSRAVSGRPKIGTTGGRRTSSMASNGSTKQPLSEKTPSNLNSFNNKPLRKSSGKPTGASPKAKAVGKLSPKKSFSPSVPQETVQHKVSPVKQPSANGIPEWKRRLANKTSSGDQPDLFSPIGLQSVFRPPTLKGKGLQKEGRKYKPSKTEEVPSSPPSHPTLPRKIPGAAAQNPAQKDQDRRSDSLDEASEEPASSLHHPRLGDSQVATHPRDKSNSDQTSNSQTPPDDDKRTAFLENGRTNTPQQDELERWREDSSLTHTVALSERSRVASGQTEDCNEGLSPCYVSRQHTVDGRIDYAAVVNTEEIRERIQDLKHQIRRPSSRSSDYNVNHANPTPSGASRSQQYPSSDFTSHSLPEDLSTGTASFMANGGFINPRRGGYSQENSFLRRPLSPSSSACTQTRVSSIATAVRRNSTGSSARSSPGRAEKSVLPSTPKSRQAERSSSSERPRSSGSPLKLFGQYDTFTNDRLARHMSRFEQNMPDNLEEDDNGDADQRRPSRASQSRTSRLSSFGEGQLDSHAFDTRRPLPPPRKEGARPQLPAHESGDFKFSQVDEDVYDSIPRRKRKTRPSTTMAVSEASHQHSKAEDGQNDGDLHQEEEIVSRTANGKRLPHSPAKHPQPKRRRTLLESELTVAFPASLAKAEVTEVSIKSVLGRKRKDALYDNNTRQADPDVLANRHILRPRNPTPNQSGHHGVHGVWSATGLEADEPLSKNNGVRHRGNELVVDSSTEKLAEELASLALNVVPDMSDIMRKLSMPTGDFFNEARQIMRLLRTQGRPPSSHISEENLEDEYNSRLLDSTRDEFSRPPSREGGSLRRVHGPAQLDARVVSQLRKYEDNDDVGMVLSSSLKSLKVTQSAGSQLAEDVRKVVGRHGADLESDANVRILDSASRKHARKHSSATEVPTTSTGQSQSFGSHSTSGPSTAQSVPTDSSRGSRNKAMIALETVAHLLSDQVAGMTFDHEQQVWVKSRNSSKSESASKLGSASSEITDDDLLDAIPDLSVDELEEMKRVKVADYASTHLAPVPERVSHQDHAITGTHIKPPADNSSTSDSRPQMADGRQIGLDDVSSAPSQYSHFTSSGTVPATKATSWGDEAFTRKTSGKGLASYPSETDQHAERVEEVEHEISILEGRVSQTPQRKGYRQPRVVTVAFSSPLVDQIEGSYLRQDSEEENDEPVLATQVSERRMSSSVTKLSVGFRRGTGHRSASRRASLGQPSYVPRPMSRLDEHEELSIVRCSNGAGIDVVLSTPLNKHSSAVPNTSGQISSIGFQLSPLSEFTVHQVDRPLDRSLNTNGQDVQALHPSQMQVSLSAQEIVKKITDVEPYEPYWEYLHTLDLCDRGVQTLHMLNDFCARLEELEVSNNQLGEVNGAPSSLRCLKVRRNCLSSLTAWGHLYNLQYLDVSHNQLTNLRGFQSLVHLRELKADDNQIDILEGVFGLDGLIKLSLKRNRIRWVDFEEADLKRLTHLNLLGNELTSIYNADRLPTLKHLVLSDNNLENFDEAFPEPHSSLESLNLSNNTLSKLSISNLPNLHTLYLDGNAISHVPNLSSHKALSTLSWRSQTLSQDTEIDWHSAHNITSLYLSGNTLSTFAPTSPFLNLQALELASTGLQTLSPDFGLQCPNLRTLNLNYNALRDLEPLLGIVHLQRLYIAGNRLSRLRRTATVLQNLSAELIEVDMRSNPITVGFYTPQSTLSATCKDEKQMVLSSAHPTRDEEDSDEQWAMRAVEAYLLHASDREADKLSRERLDEDTKLRRRVYEMLLAANCSELRTLDGLEVDREDIGRRDEIWDRLRELGILRLKEGAAEGDEESFDEE